MAITPIPIMGMEMGMGMGMGMGMATARMVTMDMAARSSESTAGMDADGAAVGVVEAGRMVGVAVAVAGMEEDGADTAVGVVGISIVDAHANNVRHLL